MILWQKATKGTSLDHPDGEVHYTPTDSLDGVAMRVEGAASSWVNAVLQEISKGRRPVFRTWAQFRDAMVQRFELVTEVEEVRK